MFNKLVTWFRPKPIPQMVARLLPSDSRRFGPPRRWGLASSLGGAWTDLGPRVRPLWAPPFPLNFQRSRDLERPSNPGNLRRGVFQDVPARILQTGYWVVVDDDRLILDANYWTNAWGIGTYKHCRIYQRKKGRPLRTLPGRTLTLASDFCGGGYGHWLHDALTRLDLLKLAGISVDSFDHILLPTPDAEPARWLRRRAGLPDSRVIDMPPGEDLEVESLTGTTLPGYPETVGPHVASFYRGLMGATVRTRRIYITREGYRRNLANGPAVAECLTSLGFESCRPDKDPSIYEKCAEAEIIVSLEGSQAINAVFAPPGSWVVIVMPASRKNSPFMATMAAGAGLNLAFFNATSQPGMDPGEAPMSVDVPALGRALRDILDGRLKPDCKPFEL